MISENCFRCQNLESELSTLRAEVERKEKAIVKAHVMMGALETITLELDLDRQGRIQKIIDEFKQALHEGGGEKG